MKTIILKCGKEIPVNKEQVGDIYKGILDIKNGNMYSVVNNEGELLYCIDLNEIAAIV